jgi:hypothetical protein
MAMKKSGRSVARLPAVIARPCSTDDQMAMSSVDPGRVSTRLHEHAKTTYKGSLES